MNDDTEYWASVSAEELSTAMTGLGIAFNECYGDADGDVCVMFGGIADAEALLTLGIGLGPRGPRTLYDRATSSCVTLSAFANQDGPTPSERITHAIDAGWKWTVHPDMHGLRMGWHVAVDIPSADADQVTATLNAMRLGVS